MRDSIYTRPDYKGPVQAGWELTGEYRAPRAGETFLTNGGGVLVAEPGLSWYTRVSRHILRVEGEGPSVTVDQVFTVTFKGHEIELTKGEAYDLFRALDRVLT